MAARSPACPLAVAVVACALSLVACGGSRAAPPPGAAAPRATSELAVADPVLIAAERLLARRSVAALAGMSAEAREEEIFGALYNELDAAKPRTTSADEYAASLRRGGTERARDAPPWHVRWGVDGTADLSADVTRFYFDVLPDHAATLADELTAELDRGGVRRYSFKVVGALELIDIPVAAVLYVEAPDLETALRSALGLARAHPEALWPEEAPLTQRLAPGLSVAEEIGAVGPPGVAGNSFGGAMAHLFARALEGAGPASDASALAGRMRAELRAAGFDPAAPWRRPRAAP